MKRILAIAFVLCLSIFNYNTASAQEKKFFIENDGSVTLREVASDVAKLKDQVATLEKQVKALRDANFQKNNPKLAPAPSKPATVQYKTVRTQVCTNGVCRIVNQLVPLTEAEMASQAKGTNCPNCTTCADGCTCVGGGYYCADGKCPITFGASTTGDGSCASGSCGSSSSGRTGWYLGKRLGR